MANSSGKGGVKFKKGVSGNPKGRPKSQIPTTFMTEIDNRRFINYLQFYGSMNREQISRELQRPDATMFELMFGNIVAKAAKGERDSREVLLNRLFGKVKDSVEHIGEYSQVVVQLPPKNEDI